MTPISPLVTALFWFRRLATPERHRAGPDDESMNKPLVLLLTFGTGGDLQPFLTLAAGLQGLGNRTLLIAPRFHEKAVQDTGLDLALFGTHERVQLVLDDPELRHERKGFGVAWRGVAWRGVNCRRAWMKYRNC